MGAAAAAVAAYVNSKVAALAQNVIETVNWKVPAGVKRVRVRSFDEKGKQLQDTVLRVVPNQTFIIDAIKED